MRKLWRLVVRVVFWSYERGSLPYDLMVIAILIFVLLTPRHWFNDQPSLHAPLAAGQIRLVDVDTKNNTELFRIDASLLAPAARASELEKESHELLSRRVSSLHGSMFQIVQIQSVRAADGTVVAYDVRIKSTHSPLQ